jgi:ribosomal protein S18 acetylase RimI-like enzyme
VQGLCRANYFRRVTLEIRAESAEDCDAIALLHVLAWQKAYRGLLPDEVLDTLSVDEWARKRRERLGNDGPRRTIVATLDGVVVGFARFGPDRYEEEFGEIQAIYVHPDYWGKGAGDALIRTALENLPQQEVGLWMLEGNERAQRFYARYGLHPSGTRHTYRHPGSDFDAPELRVVLRRG